MSLKPDPVVISIEENTSNVTVGSTNRQTQDSPFSRSPNNSTDTSTSTMDTEEVIDVSTNVAAMIAPQAAISNESSQYNSQSQNDDTTTLPNAKEVVAGYRQLTPQTAADYTYMMGWVGAGVSGPVALHGAQYEGRKRSFSKVDNGLELYMASHEISDQIETESSRSESPEQIDGGEIRNKFIPSAIGPFNPVFDTSSPRMPVFETPTLTPLTPQQAEMESKHIPRRLNRGRSHHGYVPGAVHPYSRAPIAGQTRERSPTPDFDTARPQTDAPITKGETKNWWDQFLYTWCCWPEGDDL
ncbi:hypothetical protein B0I72DRAFT_175259 [Yarrowia lipolytica]|uniref:YALI0A09614p n=1 Tax=Yarrowia lipolytica (strain CLIB 122 / E 150) TaxID=284591 RepID=Q6CHF0_YARLI|nr:YALI0A09614p [Yarrowia lipolytica CLIB122]RDW31675.1 hypothetical protein B0I72DRAFT_175259 [Yarrowia lipolytica]CAG83838.1 YALI0A09614p [Yarrowia lipolytica CLIB122]|eukprot:XP_499911.1 YALI0A09614p [Yarrowia lipolytica CLIB122]